MEKTGERGSERGTHAFGKELNDDVETRRTEHVLLRRRRLIRFRLSTWNTIKGRPMHQLRKLCEDYPDASTTRNTHPRPARGRRGRTRTTLFREAFTEQILTTRMTTRTRKHLSARRARKSQQ